MANIGNRLAEAFSTDTNARMLAVAGDTVPSPSSTGTTPGNPEQLHSDASEDDAASVVDQMSPLAASAAANSDFPDPKSFRQATAHSNPYHAEWKRAADAEMAAHRANGTWKLVSLPVGKKAIGCTWVFRTKRGKNGEILKHKARLCFRGDRQQFGIDYQFVFAPTVKYQTLRTLLALAAYYDLEVQQFDVVTAFLNAEITDVESIYMHQPDGYVQLDSSGKPFVCKMLRALYGLKQAPREWNQLLTAWLVNYGFTQNLADPGCYTLLVQHVRNCCMFGSFFPLLVLLFLVL